MFLLAGVSAACHHALDGTDGGLRLVSGFDCAL